MYVLHQAGDFGLSEWKNSTPLATKLGRRAVIFLEFLLHFSVPCFQQALPHTHLLFHMQPQSMAPQVPLQLQQASLQRENDLGD